MSQYLQRLVRPTPPGAMRAGLAAPTRQAPPGVQGIEHIVETGLPASAAPGLLPATPGMASGEAHRAAMQTAAGTTASSLEQVTQYVTRWLAAPTRVPPEDAGGVTGGTRGQLSDGPSPTGVGGPPQPVLPSDPAIVGTPSTHGLAWIDSPHRGVHRSDDPFAVQVPAVAEASHLSSPVVAASSGDTLPSPAHARPVMGAHSVAQRPQPSPAMTGARQVEVHIGSIALTVKAPASAPTAAPPRAAATPVPPVRSHAVSGAPLRFSIARHHLRWS